MSNTNTVPMDAFTPDDIVAGVILIDMAAANGVFKGWDDIQKAFTVRNRLLAFAEQWNNTVRAAESSVSETPSPTEGNQ